MRNFNLLAVFLLISASPAFGLDRYVSTSGSDSAAGTQSNPWRSISHALESASSGDVVYLEDGQYGSINESSNRGRSSYLTIKARNLHKATVPSISLSYGSLTNSYLRIDGLNVYRVNNGGLLVNLSYAKNVELLNLNVHSDRYAKRTSTPGAPTMISGVRVYDCENVTVDRAKIYEINKGGQVQDTKGFTLKNSYIAMKGSSGWQNLFRNEDTLFENNHWHGSDYIPEPEGWNRYPTDPDGPDRDHSHASMISHRSGNVTIRGNHFHGYGSSAGMMWYGVASAGDLHHNIVIENNLIYDSTNGNALRFYNTGNNIKIRNNLVFSRYRTDADGCTLILSTAMIFHASPPDPSTLEISNNILMGSVGWSSGAIERNNIVWAVSSSISTSPTSVPGFDGVTANGTLVAKTGGKCYQTHDNVFEVPGRFFESPPNFLFPSNSHVDWTLAEGSVGRNFGDPNRQTPVSIGSLDPDGIFLLNNGVARSASVHSVGPMEDIDHATVVVPRPPTAVSVE